MNLSQWDEFNHYTLSKWDEFNFNEFQKGKRQNSFMIKNV